MRCCVPRGTRTAPSVIATVAHSQFQARERRQVGPGGRKAWSWLLDTPDDALVALQGNQGPGIRGRLVEVQKKIEEDVWWDGTVQRALRAEGAFLALPRPLRAGRKKAPRWTSTEDRRITRLDRHASTGSRTDCCAPAASFLPVLGFDLRKC